MGMRSAPVALIGRESREVKKLYQSAFSREDRMPFWLMVLLAKRKDTVFTSFYDGDTFCGFAYLATALQVTFLMFLAVEPALQSRGYGSAILEHMESLRPGGKTIVSIERCDEHAGDDAQRLRRRQFYERNGYQRTGYFIDLGGKEQEILMKNGAFDREEFLARIWQADAAKQK